MQYVLAALTAVGIILSFVTGPIGLALAIPAGVALLLLLRARQPRTPVDHSYTGGAQPDMDRAAQVEKTGHDRPTA